MLKTDWNICYINYDFYIFLKLLLARHYCYASPHKNIGSHREDPGIPKKNLICQIAVAANRINFTSFYPDYLEILMSLKKPKTGICLTHDDLWYWYKIILFQKCPQRAYLRWQMLQSFFFYTSINQKWSVSCFLDVINAEVCWIAESNYPFFAFCLKS